MMQSAYAKKQQEWTKCETAYFYLAQMMEEIEDPEATISYFMLIEEKIQILFNLFSWEFIFKN